MLLPKHASYCEHKQSTNVSSNFAWERTFVLAEEELELAAAQRSDHSQQGAAV